MLLLCPNCHQLVETITLETPNQVRCPQCHHEFTAPSTYQPEVIDPANRRSGRINKIGPPPVVGSTAEQTPPTATARPSHRPQVEVVAADLPDAAGYSHTLTLTIPPKLIAWLPVIFYVAALVSTFFPWVGIYVGRFPLATQGPWRALAGSVSTDEILLSHLEKQIPLDWRQELPSDAGLMLLGIILIALCALLAAADRGLNESDARNIPPLAPIWPYRRWVLLLMGMLAVVAFYAQSLRGFGMERAIRTMTSRKIDEQFAQERAEATVSRSKQALLEYRMEQELRRYGLEHTLWMKAGLLAITLGFVSVVVQMWLEQRGNKPLPRLILQW